MDSDQTGNSNFVSPPKADVITVYGHAWHQMWKYPVVLFVVFQGLTLTLFSQSSTMKSAVGPSLNWYNEIDRYSSLFAFSADGSMLCDNSGEALPSSSNGTLRAGSARTRFFAAP